MTFVEQKESNSYLSQALRRHAERQAATCSTHVAVVIDKQRPKPKAKDRIEQRKEDLGAPQQRKENGGLDK
jgi:hypothetical protein